MDDFATSPDNNGDVFASLLADKDNEAALSVLQHVFDAMEDGVALWDENIKFVLCNDRYYEYIVPPNHPRLKRGDCGLELGKAVFAQDFFVMPDDVDPQLMAEQMIEVVKSYQSNLELERTDGTVLSISSKKTAFGGYLLTFKDITDRKRFEAAGVQRLDALKDAIEALEEGFAFFDGDFDSGEFFLVMCNQKYMDHLYPLHYQPFPVGTKGEDVCAAGYHSGLYEIPDSVSVDEWVHQWVTWGRSHAGPAEVHFKDGRLVVASAKQTGLGGVLVTTVDVTEHKKAEQAQKEASELVQKVVEACPANFLMSRVEGGEVLFRSNASQELFGEQVSAQGHWSNLNDRERYLSKLEQNGRVDDMFVVGLKFDGTPFPSQVSARLVDYQGEKVIVSSTTDLTEAFALRDERDASNARLRDAIEALDEGFVLYDQDRRFVMANARYREMLAPYSHMMNPGTHIGDIVGQAVADGFVTFLDEKKNSIESIFSAVEQTGFAQAEVRLTNGSHYIINLTGLKDGGLAATAVDVTEKVRAEQLLSDAISRLPVGVAVETPEGTLTHCNNAFASFYDRTTEELMALSFDERMEVIYPKVASVNEIIIEGDPIKFHNEFADTERGSLVPLEASFKDGRRYLLERAPTHDDGRVVVMTDITKLKVAEENRLASINDAIEGSGDGLVLFDSESRFVLGNKAFNDMFWTEIEPPYVGEKVESLFQRLIDYDFYVLPQGVSKQQAFDGGIELFYNHGKNLPINTASGRNILASSHQTGLDGFLISFRDVTEERNSEEKARAMLYAAMESLEEGFALWDSDMGFVTCNQRYVDIFLTHKGQPFPVGTTIEEATLEIFRADVIEFPQEVTEDLILADIQSWVSNFEAPREFQFKDGRVVILAIKPTELGGFLVTALDVTEERNSEQKARAMLYDAMESLEEGFSLWDKDLNFQMCNQKYLDLVMPFLDEPFPMGTPVEEVNRRVFQSGHVILPEGLEQEDFVADLIHWSKHSGEAREFQSSDGRIAILRSQPTDLGGFLVTAMDITEERNSEKRQLALEEELEQQRETAHQNEKLSALGELLAGVAHELNNPLSVVFGYAQMLQGKVDDPTISKRIDMIGQSAERAAKIVKTFLAMARQRPTKIEICSLNETIGTALEVSTYALTANGTKVIIKLDETIPDISGDFDQLAQVFTNLIVNAGHALEPKRDKGILTIRSFYDAKTDHSVVEIKDNGPGIPKDIQSRIFEPFFTTKEVGKGTGVGLAFSHRIVDSHGGLLVLKSEHGAGTSFFVKLRSAKPANVQVKVEEVQSDKVTGKRILVIDDEAAVAELVTDILNERGFTVTTQTNSKEALHLLEQTEYDAIISDFKMPLMNGEQFFNAAKVIAPEAANRIGFMTGDAMSNNVKNFFASSKRPHIEKPINADELTALIQKLIDGV